MSSFVIPFMLLWRWFVTAFVPRVRMLMALGLTCVILPLVAALPASAQNASLGWQPMRGPTGRVTHLTAEGDGVHLYATSVTGVHRKEDQTQWQSAGNFMRSDALYRSLDGGITWEPATNDLVPGAITALYADPPTGNLYVGLVGAGDDSARRQALWRSGDRGNMWQPVSLDRDDLSIRRVIRSAQGRYLFFGAADTADPPSSSYVYRSSDGGATWQPFEVSDGRQVSRVVLTDLIPHPTDPERLFLTAVGGNIYMSSDGGKTWSPSPGTPASNAKGAPLDENPTDETGSVRLAISPQQPDIMLTARTCTAGSCGDTDSKRGSTLQQAAGGDSTKAMLIERSMDGGSTWAVLPASGLPTTGEPNALLSLTGQVFLLNTDRGTYRSADGGMSWQLLEGPLSNGGVSEFLTLQRSTVLAATGYGIFVSRDAGALWQRLGDRPSSSQAGLPFNSNVIGLLTDVRQPERTFVVNNVQAVPGAVVPPLLLRGTSASEPSSVTGRSWSWIAASPGLASVQPTGWALDPNDPNAIFIVGLDRFLRSIDGGLNWQTIRLDSSDHRGLAVTRADSNVLYVGGHSLLRSADRGMTWQQVATPGLLSVQQGDISGLAVDPTDAKHVWAGLSNGGVHESTDGGLSWQEIGLSDRPIRWLSVSVFCTGEGQDGDSLPCGTGEGQDEGPVRLFAGVSLGGIYRWDHQSRSWTPASDGLPDQSNIMAFLADPRVAGMLWAGREGGGIYRSTDFGDTWSATSDGFGDNLAQALTPDYTTPGSLLVGTATAGIWTLRSPPQSSAAPSAIDARIEILWPHDSAPVSQAKMANLGLRLFLPRSLQLPSCEWVPKVTIWQAVDSDPAEPLGEAEQRSIDGHPFPYWELNDIDVSHANSPAQKLYYMIRVAGTDTTTSIWVHGVDPRTYFPYQDVPSGIALGDVQAVDTRIQIVWPHDEAGKERSVTEATQANVAVALFEHGTRLSVPVGWQPGELVLYGAWNQEVGKPLAREARPTVRKSGAITYPVWEFDNIPVERAVDPRDKLHLWVLADGADSYPTIWTHGADARTFFPTQDEPIQGCVP